MLQSPGLLSVDPTESLSPVDDVRTMDDDDADEGAAGWKGHVPSVCKSRSGIFYFILNRPSSHQSSKP